MVPFRPRLHPDLPDDSQAIRRVENAALAASGDVVLTGLFVSGSCWVSKLSEGDTPTWYTRVEGNNPFVWDALAVEHHADYGYYLLGGFYEDSLDTHERYFIARLAK